MAVGEFVSATATKSNVGFTAFTDTSEFARNVAAVSSAQGTITVDTSSDTWDGDTTSLSTLLANKGGDGFVSLREAILAANNTANGASADRITFNVAGAGAHTIVVNGPGGPNPSGAGFDYVVDPVVIDATTQPGYSGSPLIRLDGAGATGSTAGIALRTNNSTIRGLSVTGFPDDGLEVDGSTGFGDGNLLEQNWVGLTPTGAAAGNLDDGILVSEDADNNVVRNNVVGSNGKDGIVVRNTGSSGNWIAGNIVGLNAAASAARPNVRHGIALYGDAPDNIIGTNNDGTNDAAEANTVANNLGAGVSVTTTGGGNSILRNSIFANGLLGIDLGAVGVTDNDPGDPDSGANNLQNFPVLTLAMTNGAQVDVTGTLNSTPNTQFRVEFFASTAQDGTGYGEGQRYLGSFNATTDGSGNATISTTLAATVAVGEFVGATATKSNVGFTAFTDTSEFAQNVVAVGTGSIAGTVYEDVTGIGSLAGAVTSSNVTVRLFRDNGDGAPGAGDTLVGTTTTSAGNYTFSALTDATYWVAVDSKTIQPSAGLRGGFGQGDVWAEQTYGSAGSVGYSGSYTFSSSAGSFFGGMRGGVSDDASTLAGSEHVTRVVTTGGAATGVNSAFSFNVVTTIRGGDAADDDGGANRTVQGSLRQFIQNADAITGANAMRFVPVQAANVTSGADSWWRVLVSNALPQITDASTTIDGRAYSAADGSTIRDTNTGQLGAGGTVGTDAVALPKVEKPELEIQGDRTVVPATSIVSTGLEVNANTATIRRISIYGFGKGLWNNNFANIGIRPGFSGTLIENNVIGSGAGAFTDPGAAARTDGANVLFDQSVNGTVQNNVIGFSSGQGIWSYTASSTGWTITGNEIRSNVQGTVYFTGGIEIDGGAGQTVTGNLITGHNGPGINIGAVAATDLIRNNTVTGNGLGVPANYTAGIRVGGGSGGLVEKNIVATNVGAGVQIASAVTGLTVSRNSIYDNGLVSGQIGIDLLTPSDGTARGTSPFVTLNAAGARTGGNNLMNFPVIDTATVVGGNLTLTGWSKPGSVIEVFLSDSTSGFGEGKTYLASFTEGVLDGDPATGNSYGPGTVHGVSQGTDTTNRFSFTIPTPSGVSYGTYLTATATDTSGNTSEFSANFLVNSAPVLTGANNLTTIAEDPPTNDSGTAVSALIAGMVTDDDPITGSGIAVTGAATGNGSWEYSLNGGSNWLPLGSPSPSVARLLDDSGPTRLRFVPNADWNGTLVGGLTFRAWDRSRGDSGDTYDTTDNGGSSAFSAATASSDITVSAVADTPSVTPATTPEDTQSTSGLVISRNAADGAEVTHFKIRTAIGNGTLYQNDGTTQINDE